MGAHCSDCVARTQFDPKVHSRFAQQVSNGRRQLLENNVGENPADGYEIGDEVIGVGGFAVVRLAVSKRTKAECALKTICKTGTNSESIHREIDVLLDLDHPHVIRLFDVYEDWRNVYMVFEMCSGGEVLEQIMVKRRFLESDALLVLAQLLYAINYFHSKQIAHRDIKLENILLKQVVEDLSEVNLKVIDFGVARRFVPGKATMSTQVGTPTFVAPEVLGYDVRYNEKVDIWSAGVVGYMLLSASVPFVGKTREETLKRVKLGTLEFPRKKWQNVSQKAKDLIQSMLTRKITKRADAQGALERLKAAMEGETEWSTQSDGELLNSPRKSTGSCASANSTPRLHDEYFDRLVAFWAHDRFVKAGWHLIARHLEAEYLEEFQDAFKQLDMDGTGVLTSDELKDGFYDIGFEFDEVEEAFSHIDASEHGQIDYTYFVAALMDKAHCKREELCWEAFRVFDRDNDGHIGVDDLHATLQSTSKALPQVTKDEVLRLIQKYDKDGDRRISFQEFVAMMERHSDSHADVASDKA